MEGVSVTINRAAATVPARRVRERRAVDARAIWIDTYADMIDLQMGHG